MIPPDYMLYEAYGLNYRSYYEGGLKTARWIADTFQAHIDLTDSKILDWGCGPGRVVRHLPKLLPKTLVFGTDYNKVTILWCLEHFPDVRFQINDINPPLGYPPLFFDAIYGISIFTHLSRSNHNAWIKELCRRLKDFGLLLITTQGAAHTTKLTHREQEAFRKGEIVIREGIKEGHLTYSAFHPEQAMRNLFAGYFEVLSFTPGIQESWGIGQDTWLLQKN